jgi:hypothetical protein
MITINHSWSLGLCPNKSLEAFESPVCPRRGDHPERFSEEISEMGGEILALDEAEGTGNIRSDLSRARQRSPAAKDPDPFRKFVLRTALTPENNRLSVRTQSADSPVRGGVSSCSDSPRPAYLFVSIRVHSWLLAGSDKDQIKSDRKIYK